MNTNLQCRRSPTIWHKNYCVLYVNSCNQVTIPDFLRNTSFAVTPLSLIIPQLRGSTDLGYHCFVQRPKFVSAPVPRFEVFFFNAAFCRLVLRMRGCVDHCFVLSFSLSVCQGFIKLYNFGRYVLMQPARMLWTHACCIFLMRNLFLHLQFRGASVICVSQ